MRHLIKQLLALLGRNWFWIILALTLLTWAMWTLHYHQQLLQEPGALQRWAKALSKGLFSALQFLVLNKELDEGLQRWQWWALACTQLLMPIFASLALLSAIFREYFEPLWEKLALSALAQDGFWIIVGADKTGQSLCASLQAGGKKAIVIDRHARSSQDGYQGHYLQRDIGAGQSFLGLPVHKAVAVVLALPDEDANLQVLQELKQLLARQPRTEPMLVHCQVNSHDLLKLFMDQPGLELADCAWLDIRPLHMPMMCARAVIQHYPASPCLLPTDAQQHDVMVVGNSAMAQALVLRLARVGIFTPHGQLRLWWLGEGADQGLRELAAHYPALGDQLPHAPSAQAPALPGLQIHVMAGQVCDLLHQGQLQTRLGQQWPSVIYIAHASEAKTLADARELQIHGGLQALEPKRPVPIVALMQTHRLRPAALPLPETHWRCAIHIVETHSLVAEHLLYDQADVMAKSYDAIWSSATKIDIAAWRNQHFLVKESNRDIADHLPIKLRYAGFDAAQIAQLLDRRQPLTPEQRSALEQRLSEPHTLAGLITMEQQRYRAFMALSGFRAANPMAMATAASLEPKRLKQVERCLRINTTLGLALQDLPPAEVVKDRNIILHTADILALSKQLPSATRAPA